MAKIRIEDIQTELRADGWKVISTEYTNLDTQMTFECPEGHRVYTSWKKLRAKRECPTCSNNTYAIHDGEILTKPKGTTRVVALDQATHVTGWSVFDNNKLVAYGAFTASAAEDIDRYVQIKSWLLSMIATWRPDRIGIEGIQFQEETGGQKISVTVFETLARLQGVLLVTCQESKIPCEICPTNTWRHYCGVKGRSRADKKRSMQMLVKQQYDVSVSDDEADAIGIGHYVSGHIIKNTVITNWET